MFKRKMLLIGISLLLLVGLTTAVSVEAQQHWYAVSTIHDDPITGMRSNIEVADPFVASGFSLETNWIVDDPNGRWIELGWMKTDDGQRRYYSYCGNCGVEPWGWHGDAPCCDAHQFTLWYDNVNNRWGLYIDGSNVRLVPTAFDRGNRAVIGGEVTSNQNEIGVSGLLSVRYWKNWGAQFLIWDGIESADPGYWIREIWGTHDNMQNGTS